MSDAYKVLTYRGAAGPRAGVLVDNAVFDLAGLGGLPERTSVLDLLNEEGTRFDDIGNWIAGRKPQDAIPVAQVELMAPVLYPGQMYIAGSNYKDHVAEMRRARQDGTKEIALQSPWHVLKASRPCIVGPGAHVRVPRNCQKFDWEVELAVIIGRTTAEVPVGQALDYVAGYAIANDLSARDISRRPDVDPARPFYMDWVQHKSFNGACPLGPWITPRSAVPDPQNLAMKLWVNDKLRQDANTSDMLFGVAEQISALSYRTTLYPGDVILTGTPSGTAAAYGEFLKPGDTIKIRIEGLGELVTHIDA